jgi:hypothetical protein
MEPRYGVATMPNRSSLPRKILSVHRLESTPEVGDSAVGNVDHGGECTDEKLRLQKLAWRQDIAPLPRDMECRWIRTGAP